MKVYKKKNGKMLILTNRNSGMYGGIEVVFLNYSLAGTLQGITNFKDYVYLREPTNEEINKYQNILN